MKIPDDISLSLLGAETTFADVDYMVEADVFFCNPQNDYTVIIYRITIKRKLSFYRLNNLKFNWTMSGVSSERALFLRNPGALLRIPAGILRAGEVHQIQASLLRVTDSTVILYVSYLIYCNYNIID